MNIYHYIPKPETLSSPYWQASTHKGGCYIYADNRREAAMYAYREFGIAVPKPQMGQLIPSNPWAQDNLVTVVEVAHLSGPMPPKGTVSI